MAEKDKQKEVFISYCTKDSDLVQYFCNRVEGGGVSCWIAPRDIPEGKDWAENIVKGLTECTIVAFIVSEASVASTEVAKEISLANGFKKEILQVRLENATLPYSMLYHLSNKQWVDAQAEEKSLRFNSAISAIRKLLNKNEVEIVSDNSIIGQARKLVGQLNERHGKTLDIINTPISLQEKGSDKIGIFFPVRFGATGIDLIFEYNGQKRTMELYANGVTNGDPFYTPFFNVFLKNIDRLFPQKQLNGYRYRSIFLIPLKEIPSELVMPEQLFDTFKVNVEAFSEQVLPNLLEWALYADHVIKAVKRLEDELKKVFPENEEWRVGAPEGSRLADLRSGGQINVYKDNWVPRPDNYRERGLLSFTLQCDKPYLENAFIGILKYETWHDLGTHEADIRKAAEANEILGQMGTPNQKPNWPWWQQLDGTWENSGIADMSFKWRDKLDDFIEHCIKKFKALKGLEILIDNACKDILTLQIRNPLDMPLDKQKWNDGLYVYNILRLIAENCNQKAKDAGMNFVFMSRTLDWEWVTLEVYLKFKVGEFDAAAAFTCTKRTMTVEFKSSEPPHFETEIIKSFIDSRGNYNPTAATISVSSDFDGNDGKSVVDWLVRYSAFVSNQLDKLLPEFIALKEHIEEVVKLTITVEKTIASLLTSEADWKIINNAKSMLRADAINIYHTKKWLRDGSEPDEHPPVIIQIYPEKPCFDELYLVVKFMGIPYPEIARPLGSICGACDIAFGLGETENQLGLWVRRLEARFSVTGGRSFEKLLATGEEQTLFLSYLKSVSENLLKIEPIVTKVCQRKNNLDFIKNYEVFFNKLVARLKMEFPEKDGWGFVENPAINKQKEPYYVDRWASISIFKKKWKGKESDERGLLSLFIQGDGVNFSNVYIGVVKEKDRPDQYDDLTRVLKEKSFVSFYKNWWPGCKKVIQCDPNKFGNTLEQEKCINAYLDDFVKLKSITGDIDKALGLADGLPIENDNKEKSVTSTQPNQNKPEEV